MNTIENGHYMLNLLKNLVIKNKAKLSYINIDKNNCYTGWVKDFGLTYLPNYQHIGLDLSREEDLFLLFVLASCWSMTSPWENALFFVAYLKINYDVTKIIKNKIKVTSKACTFKQGDFQGIKPRKKVTFRTDFYNSVDVLINNWDDIKRILQISAQTGNWRIFIEYISSIKGLSSKNKTMQIKIPLILRELRCQGIYSNIDGKYCCVADKRVRIAYKAMNKQLPQNYLEASKIIYKDFGDLYDIPAFAYEDLKKENLI